MRLARAGGDWTTFALHGRLVARDGHEREEDPVIVIPQVEHPGEARAGVGRLVPGAVGCLRPQQVVDAAADGPGARPPGGDQAQRGPGRLRGGRVAGPLERRVVVAPAGLAPGAGGLLGRLEPRYGAGEPGLVHRHAQRRQALEDLPGPVDVVDPPSAIPAALGLLSGPEIVQGAADGGVVGHVAQGAEQLEDAGGDVGTARVEHGVVVGERELGEDLVVDVDVVGRPAAVAVLHRQEPVDPAPARRGDGGMIGHRRAVQRQDDHGAVVEVGIELVAELEVPAGRLDARAVDGPVAGVSQLPGQQPVHGQTPGRMFGRQRGVGQRDRGDRRVPDRRHAGLQADPVVLGDLEVIELLDRPADLGRLILIAQALQGDDRVDHRREDRPQAVGLLAMLHHPAMGGPQPRPAPGGRHVPVEPFQHPVQAEEEAGPREQSSPVPGGAMRGEQLADALLGRERADRLVVGHDRQRHDDRPRPGRHRAQAELPPRRDQDQLGRDARALVVVDLSQQRQVEPREAVAGVGTAGLEDRAAGPHHLGLAGRSARQLHGEVGLHRRADVDRPARVDRPATGGQLMVLDVPGTSDADRVPLPAQERHQQDIFGFEDGVAFQLGDPVALAFLPIQQPVSGALERGLEGLMRGRRPSRRTTRARPIPGLGGDAFIPAGDHRVPYPLPHFRDLESTPAPSDAGRPSSEKVRVFPQAVHILSASRRFDQDQTAPRSWVNSPVSDREMPVNFAHSAGKLRTFPDAGA